MKYVILLGPYNNRFFTSYHTGDTHGECEVLGYANTIAEAQIFLCGRSYTYRND